MASISVDIADSDVIRMIEEFLSSRHLDISLMCLERESGIINGVYSDDGLFLRQLILDGQWDDTLEFLQPLEGVEGYDGNMCRYLIYKYKYLELLCIKHDPGPLQNHEFTLDEVVSCLTELESVCPDRKEYDNLCFLLTLPSITSDKSYKDWNPSSARISCFHELYPLVKKFVGLDRKPPPNSSSKSDRLINLVAKGLLFESAVDLCTARACGANSHFSLNHPLGGSVCSDADLSLVSWLQKVPTGTFACPFEKKTLKLKVERLSRPSLEAVWGEQLLVPPIRPKMFPHTAIPARTKSSQLVSQSMMAMYDGLSSQLSANRIAGSMSEPRSHRLFASPNLSRSFASPNSKFLLTNSLSRASDRRANPMNRSVERLFSSSNTSTPQQPASPRLVRKETKTPKQNIMEEQDILSPAYDECGKLHETEDNRQHSQETIDNQQQANKPITNNQHESKDSTAPSNTHADKENFKSDISYLPVNNELPKIVTPSDNSKAHDNHKSTSQDGHQLRQSEFHTPDSSHLGQSRWNKSSSSAVIDNQNTPDQVHTSQDLYAQFQEQKRKIEEELRQLNLREEMRQELQNTAIPEDTTIPHFNLDETAAQPEEPDVDLSDDITNEVVLDENDVAIKQFVAVETLEEQGPVRAIAFHPSGECYAVGSNTKVLRVCQYPDVSKVTTSYHQSARKPKVIAKKVKHHAGSIYCVAWNEMGSVLATGSNDHTVKCIQWLADQKVFGAEKELSLHDGTVRDISFLSDSHLLSAGAGDCTICLTDVSTGSVVRRYKGHNGHVLSIYPHRASQRFVTGGQDKKALMWDIRMSVPVHTYGDATTLADSSFASVCLDQSPRVLAAGHDNSCCSLFDLRQGRILQVWRPHSDEVRSVRFNTDATYFLTGSYDTTVKLMDMQGDITQPLRTVQVAEHMDKVIQARWHPLLPSFITSSADKTVTCWAIQIDP